MKEHQEVGAEDLGCDFIASVDSTLPQIVQPS